MKRAFLVLSVLGFFILFMACQQSNSETEHLKAQVADLQKQVEKAYKPGVGDLMGRIQIHHNKLWFAGINENWDLAKFAIVEIEELLEDMTDFHPDKPETQALPMIIPALNALDKIIDDKNTQGFKEGYLTLSNTCNGCHAATGFEFVKIVIPNTPAFSNQRFDK